MGASRLLKGTSLLRTWAALGSELRAARSAPVADWSAVHGMIEAVRRNLKADAERLRSLLKKSRKRLAPLGEPLDLDLGVHRWLEAEREEAYSDWLAWVVQQANTADRVYRLFGLDLPKGLEGNAEASVQRECCIPYGHEDCEGRLDLVIRFGHQAIIVVEVKKTDAEGTDTFKHTGYIRWLKEQPQRDQRSVFLAVSADDDVYEGFEFRSWAKVCIETRRLAIVLISESRALSAAMVLAFAAAVEQNLLEFSAEVVRHVRQRDDGVVNPDVPDHIQRFLSSVEILSMASSQDKQIEMLLKEGVRSYLEASTALIIFEQEVQTRCAEVLVRNLDDYSLAIQAKPRLSRDGVQRNVWPRDNKDITYRTVRANIGRSSMPPLGWWELICSLSWNRNDMECGCWIGEHVSHRGKADTLYRRFSALNNKTYCDDKEVGLWDTVNVEEAGNFEENLEGLMRVWIKLWKKTGGHKGVFK